jgi:hypothetical protein
MADFIIPPGAIGRFVTIYDAADDAFDAIDFVLQDDDIPVSGFIIPVGYQAYVTVEYNAADDEFDALEYVLIQQQSPIA